MVPVLEPELLNSIVTSRSGSVIPETMTPKLFSVALITLLRAIGLMPIAGASLSITKDMPELTALTFPARSVAVAVTR